MTYYEKNKEICLAKANKYYQENKDLILSKNKEIYKKNSEKFKARSKDWKENHPNYKKEEYQRNKKRYNIRQARYKQQQYLNNPLYRLRQKIRQNIGFLIKSISKDGGKYQLSIGNSFILLLKEHFEKKFRDGMDWNNYGKWTIDHVVPLSKAKTEQELLKLSHYSNLQPLWRKDNIDKGKN